MKEYWLGFFSGMLVITAIAYGHVNMHKPTTQDRLDQFDTRIKELENKCLTFQM